MQLTLEQLLSVVGPLDDAPGFDTARERFRRFISRHITDLATTRQLIDQCLRLPGVQSHRALADLVLCLGKFLDFEIVFGHYDRAPGSVSGTWRARRQLFVDVMVWTDQTPTLDVTQLADSLSAEEPSNDGERRVGLGIVTPLFPSATRLGELKDQRGRVPLYTLSLRLLLQLTEMAADRRVSQSFVVALLSRNPMLDELVEGIDLLLKKPAGKSASADDGN